MAAPVYSGPWRRIRLQILERDNWKCQIKGEKCQVKATQVDHIVSTNAGGSWWDKSNLRASCQRCNRQRVNPDASTGWKSAHTHIHLVIGPPSPTLLTTYVDKHRASTDLVVDYATIAQSLGSTDHALVNAARNAVLKQVRDGQASSRVVWITSSNPHAETMYPHHQVTIVDPGIEQACVDVTDDRSLSLIHDWYASRSPVGVSARWVPYR